MTISNKLNLPLLYISTAGIFDGLKDYYDESDTPKPMGIYAQSKYDAEKFVMENSKHSDVLIIGGFPGHVVMVAAVAENTSKEKAVLLIQSYMPAQSIHIVKKQLTRGEGVWFKVSDLEKKGWNTWEFDYTKEHLKTW